MHFHMHLEMISKVASIFNVGQTLDILSVETTADYLETQNVGLSSLILRVQSP